MKRLAFLVCSFAALLVVSVGCGGGGGGGGDVMAPPSSNPSGQWASAAPATNGCGYVEPADSWDGLITVNGNQITLEQEGECGFTTLTLSGNTVIIPPETATWTCPSGGPCEIKEVTTFSWTFTSENSYSAQAIHNYTCASGNCSQQTQPIVPCQRIEPFSGTRCQNCFTPCAAAASEPPTRQRSLWGR